MRSPEINRSSEIPQLKLDAIVVLGENIKKGWSPKEIQEDPFHLSPYSKENVLAASILYLKGATDTFIFSTGHTAGKNVPSEARAMRTHFKRILQSIRDVQIRNPILRQEVIMLSPFLYLEEKSLKTSENAIGVRKILESLEEDIAIQSKANVGLLVPGFHAQRANYHFERQGLHLKILKTEDILEEVLPSIKDKFMSPGMVAKEMTREKVIMAIERLPFGTISLGLITKITRNPNKK